MRSECAIFKDRPAKDVGKQLKNLEAKSHKQKTIYDSPLQRFQQNQIYQAINWRGHDKI